MDQHPWAHLEAVTHDLHESGAAHHDPPPAALRVIVSPQGCRSSGVKSSVSLLLDVAVDVYDCLGPAHAVALNFWTGQGPRHATSDKSTRHRNHERWKWFILPAPYSALVVRPTDRNTAAFNNDIDKSKNYFTFRFRQLDTIQKTSISLRQPAENIFCSMINVSANKYFEINFYNKGRCCKICIIIYICNIDASLVLLFKWNSITMCFFSHMTVDIERSGETTEL